MIFLSSTCGKCAPFTVDLLIFRYCVTVAYPLLYICIYLLKDACFVVEQLAVWFILSEFVLATDEYSFIVGLK